MLRRERYRGVIVWNQREKTYRKGTKVRIQRDANDWIRVDVPELRIVSDDLWFGVQRRIKTNFTPGAPAGGRPPRYLLSGITRCAECGGPMTAINGKVGSATVKAYTCAYHRDRGATVCGSSLRRSVESLNSSIVSWIRENVLSQKVVSEALRYVRQLLGARTQVSDVELAQLRQDADRLRGEIDRLVQALATSSASPQAVVEAIGSRQQRLTALEARLRAAQAAPEAISLQARRLESDAAADWTTSVACSTRIPTRPGRRCSRCSTGRSFARPSRPPKDRGSRLKEPRSSGGFSLSNPVSVTQRPQGDSKARSRTRSSTNTARSTLSAGALLPSKLDPSPVKCSNLRTPGLLVDETIELHDVTEPALLKALGAAVGAERWGLVARIAGELESRQPRRDGPPAGAMVDLRASTRQ